MKEQNGIQIRQKIMESEQLTNRRSFFSLLLTFLCFWMAVFGIFFGVIETFGISVTVEKYFIVSFVICLFWTGIVQVRRWFGFFFLCIIICYAYLFYRVWDPMVSGVVSIYNAVIDQVNLYYQLELGTISLENMASNDILWAFGMLSFIPAGILAIGTVKQNKPLLIFLFELPTILLALLLGLVVPLLSSMAMAFALIGTIWISNLNMQNKKKKQRQKLALSVSRSVMSKVSAQTSIWFVILFLIAASAAVAFSNQILEPKLRKFDYIRVNIQSSTMEDLWVEMTEELAKKLDWLLPSNPVQSGGISGGKLGGIREWKNKNEIHLKVYSKAGFAYRLYLKAYVGSCYEKNEWKPLDNYPDFPGLDIQSMGWNALGNNSIGLSLAEASITVDNVGASSLYSYVPYFSRVSEFQPQIMDATIQKQGRRSRTYLTRALSQHSIESRMEQEEIGLSKWESWYAEYENWVYEQYLQLPEHGMERLISDYETIEESLDNEKSERLLLDALEVVRRTLGDCAYSTSPGVTPEGEDFNEYFLYEQKKGLCMHFASTGTILFRLLGIPARYVEGYVLPRVDANKVNEVFDRYAHAWVEIWKDGFGWIPVEVTPGYEEDLPEILPTEETEETLEESSEETIPVETEESTVSSEEENTNEEKKEVNPQTDSMANLFIGGIVGVLLVPLICWIRKWRCRQLQKKFKAPAREAIRSIASAIKKIQQVSHLLWSDCEITKEEMEWMEQLALKARFSEHFIDPKEVQQAEAFYWKLAEQIMKKSTVRVRLKLKWIYCLK